MADDNINEPSAEFWGRAMFAADTVAELRELPGDPEARKAVCLLGWHEPGDGAGGVFYWDDGSSAQDDGGLTLGSLETGRWKRAWDGHRLHVEWFGARGSNDVAHAAANDVAIQAAMDAAYITRSSYPGGIDITPAVVGTSAAVCFGGGIFVVSSPIDISPGPFNQFMHVVSDAKAVIAVPDDTEDIFTGTILHRLRIAGLVFVGGKTALSLKNGNLDATMILVEWCEFQATADRAIQVEPVSPGSMSTLAVARSCRFYLCEYVAESYADQIRFEDCWVTPKVRSGGGAVFENLGGGAQMQHVGVLGVGLNGASNPDMRWVDNAGSFYALHSRYGGESGGFTTVKHSGGLPTYPPNGDKVIARDCQVYDGGGVYANSAFCLLEEDACPDTVILEGCHLSPWATGNEGRRLVVAEDDWDLATYLASRNGNVRLLARDDPRTLDLFSAPAALLEHAVRYGRPLGPFTATLAASQTGASVGFGVAGQGWVAPRPGSVTALSAQLSEALTGTGESVTVSVLVDAVKVVTLDLDFTEDGGEVALAKAGVRGAQGATFAAGAAVSVEYVSGVITNTPTLVATVEVQ